MKYETKLENKIMLKKVIHNFNCVVYFDDNCFLSRLTDCL